MTRQLINTIVLLLTISIIFSYQQTGQNIRQTVNLHGNWQFAIDTADIGIQQQWFGKDFQDTIELPGTMDIRHKGFLNHDTTTAHLNRLYSYEGPAWYRKKIHIPVEFQDRHIQLLMERSKPSMVWIDSNYVGKSFLLQSAQLYDVSKYLSPGEHTITLRVNNDLKLTPYGQVHIYTDETQTNWNGILGDIKLETLAKTYISDLQVFPDIDNKRITATLGILNNLNLDSVTVRQQIVSIINSTEKELKTIQQRVSCDSMIHLEYVLGESMQLWDDYIQPLYQLTVTISDENMLDRKSVPFAMRKFSVIGKQFAINDRITFLRGKHDGCVFPLTGFPPMDASGWIRVFKLARSYGINHYRFHSYCPPEAAFQAADQLGMFLMPELPFWGGLESDSVAAMLREEGQAMLKNYANHPSFVMFGPGNEIWSGHDRVEKIMVALKEKDSRPLYTMGANNNIGYVAPRAYCDFFIAARTPSSGDTILTHTRLTHAFADSREGGILNTQQPSTMANFDYPVSQINIPLISHEIGQYQIYPDYNEINKYTGVVRAWNLEIFREHLKKSGMLDQNMDFQKASGAWSAICYKAEMEAALRTAHMAGFQLLDLQDYPGQGTALVGILDAFMDSKNVISREHWLQSCNDVVLLLEFPKYCWQNNEKFKATLQLANYSNKEINNDINWNITDPAGQQLKSGVLAVQQLKPGKLYDIGEITFSLATITKAKKLTLNLAVRNMAYTNQYPLWIYPVAEKETDPDDIVITEKIDDNLINLLQKGRKVLLFPEVESVKDKSLAGLFPPDFWNYGMFKKISEWNKKKISPGTLGILTNPDHPVFNQFPTDFHSNWQWWSIIKASRPLILDRTEHGYRPVVQVIDNLERNHKLGLIFEFAVGKGKLLVCMAQLTLIKDKPEARQLYYSIINYMKSDAFKPDYQVNDKQLYKFF